MSPEVVVFRRNFHATLPEPREIPDNCLKSKEAADAVSNDAQSGKELGITATPTLILNGKLIKKIPTEREMKTYLSNDN